jgi:FdhE protein
VTAVASNLVRKLLGRKPSLPAEVEQAHAELARLGQEKPVVAELASQVSACLSAAFAEPVRVAVPSITREAAAEKLRAGVPLLRGERLDIDWPTAQRRFQDVAGALIESQAEAAPAVANAVRSEQLEIAELTAALLAGQPHMIHQRVGALGLDVTFTASVIPLALFPVLVPIRVGLEPLLAADHWQEGYCPVCGGYPKLGEFRGLEQLRFLRCGLCAAEWQFPRLRCPACGNHDHRQLGYLHVDGEQNKCRAATCEACRQYVKMVSTLAPLPPLQLWVTDVATVHIDLLAADHGFSPPM